MRLFLLLSLISFNSFAQLDVGSNTTTDCTDADFLFPAAPPANNVFECRDVTISTLSTADLFDPSLPLTIKATGNVSIGSIDFSGQPPFLGGGEPGAGGGSGGEYLTPPGHGLPLSRGGNMPTGPATCTGGSQAEGAGGAGGSLEDAGQPGLAGVEIIGTGTVVPGGLPGSTITIDINNLTFAGSGGGAGERGCDNTFDIAPGAGGGGGGGIKIAAAGNVSIGTINVSGGAGGSVSTNAGGGGGGSGGIIIIQSLGQITTTSLLAESGAGGTNTAAGGDGGNGAPGVIFLQDADGIVPGSFSPATTPTPINGSTLAGKGSFSSDISCGTIASKNENKNPFFQMIIGFGFVLMISQVRRRTRLS